MGKFIHLGTCVLLWGGFASLVAAAPDPAASPRHAKKTVLLLCGERSDLPAMRAIEQNVREVFHGSTEPEIELFPEYLDFARFPSEEHGESNARYLRDRYAGRKIDLILAVGGFGLEFALTHRDELFPNVPIVFSASDQRELQRIQLPPDVTGVIGHFDIDRTVELIFALQPDVTEIAVVGGTSGFDRRWEDETRKVLEHVGSRVRSRWITDKSLEETLAEVSRLPASTAVLYVSMLRDGAGHSMTAVDSLRDVVRVSPSPVYAMATHLLNEGAVGGAAFDFGKSGRDAAEVALKILRGHWVSLGSPEMETANPLIVNWPALKRWHLPESRIPAEAQVRLKPPRLWDTQRGVILGVIGIILLQGLLISGLIAQRLRRRTAEASLRQSEERMRLATEAVNLAIWEWDLSKDELWATSERRQLLGWSADSRTGLDEFISKVHPDDRNRIREAIKNVLASGRYYDCEYRVILPDGKIRWMAARGNVHADGHGKPARILGISIDITARKQAELDAKQRRDDLGHLSRVTLMGEMAASLAHELNQPLSGIISNASAGQRFIDRGNIDLDELRELLADIGADGRRAGEVVRGIRSMVKKGGETRQRINLNEVVQNVVHMVAPDALLHSCELQTSLDANLPSVEADPVQVQQVLLNLIVNAFDAMGEIPSSQRKVEIATSSNGNGTIRTSVRDHGLGISKEASDRLFEQFFTTKTDGLGMGLAIVRSIVESHSGTIAAENADGGGARFHFTLPTGATSQSYSTPASVG